MTIGSALKQTASFLGQNIAADKMINNLSEKAIKGIGTKFFGAGKGDEIRAADLYIGIEGEKEKKIFIAFLKYLESLDTLGLKYRSFCFSLAAMQQEKGTDAKKFLEELLAKYDSEEPGDERFAVMFKLTEDLSFTTDSTAKLVKKILGKLKINMDGETIEKLNESCAPDGKIAKRTSGLLEKARKFNQDSKDFHNKQK